MGTHRPAGNVTNVNQSAADSQTSKISPGSSQHGMGYNKSVSIIVSPPEYGRPSSAESSHRIMFTKKIDSDPIRDSMAISIISIFFCCFFGLLATGKASKAMDHLKRSEGDEAQRASASARKYACTAVFVGLFIYFISLIINTFYIRQGDYRVPRYGHYHLINETGTT